VNGRKSRGRLESNWSHQWACSIAGGGGASDLNPTVERGVTDYKGANISWKLLSSRDIYIF
jgi:hypothetical protein